MQETQRTTDEALTNTEAKRLRKAIDLSNRRSTLVAMLIRGFIGGLGSTLGVAVVLTLVYWSLNYLNFIPGASEVREFLSTLRQSI